MKSGVGERKQRSDKKIDVKPTMSISLKHQLYHFAELSNEPVKDIAERLCVRGMFSHEIVDDIRRWFRRDYFFNSTLVKGYMERPKLKLNFKDDTGKVTIRFVQSDYDKLCELAHALDQTPTSTATVLIKMTMRNIEFMSEFMNSLNQIDAKQKAVVQNFLYRILGMK